MARPLVFVERVLARFPAGTLARISAVLGKGEDRSGFIRAAVDTALERAEASQKSSRTRLAQKPRATRE